MAALKARPFHCPKTEVLQVMREIAIMGWREWTAFALLCLISGTSWIIPSASELPSLEEQAILYFFIGMFGLVWEWSALRKRPFRQIATLAAASIAFFGGPMLAVEYARGAVGEITRSALFAMSPVIVVMTVASFEDSDRSARRFLVPALTGAAGLLLLLPINLPASMRSATLFGLVVLAVLLAAISSVWLYRILRHIGLAEAITVAGVSNAIFLLASSILRDEFVWRPASIATAISPASLVDVVEIVLILWLLGRMMPIRFASCFLLIPLVTIFESFALERPPLTLRAYSGTALLAAGAGLLLLWRADEDTVLSLR